MSVTHQYGIRPICWPPAPYHPVTDTSWGMSGFWPRWILIKEGERFPKRSPRHCLLNNGRPVLVAARPASRSNVHMDRVFEFESVFYAQSASEAIFRARVYSHITYSVRDDEYLMNETRRKPTTGGDNPLLYPPHLYPFLSICYINRPPTNNKYLIKEFIF